MLNNFPDAVIVSIPVYGQEPGRILASLMLKKDLKTFSQFIRHRYGGCAGLALPRLQFASARVNQTSNLD